MSMTVKELIQELEKFPPDMEVVDMSKEPIERVYESTWVHSNYPYNLPDKQVVVIYHKWRKTPCFSYGDISHILFSRSACANS